jgi:hypothetical protein
MVALMCSSVVMASDGWFCDSLNITKDAKTGEVVSITVKSAEVDDVVASCEGVAEKAWFCSYVNTKHDTNGKTTVSVRSEYLDEVIAYCANIEKLESKKQPTWEESLLQSRAFWRR